MPSSGKSGAGWSARLTSSLVTSIAPKTWRLSAKPAFGVHPYIRKIVTARCP